MANILSLELIIFIGILIILMRLRKTSIWSVSLVEGLRVYVPPTDEDFALLEPEEKTTKVKTNMKGDPKKKDKQKFKQEQKQKEAASQFPMRTMEVAPELLKYNQDFFQTYDFILLMFITCVLLFVFTTSLQLVPNQTLQKLISNNLTFYIMALVQILIIQNLIKNTFNLGYLKFTDETKLEFLMGMKSFSLVFILFKSVDSSVLFDYKIESLHSSLIDRINQALAPFGVYPKTQVPLEYTMFIFALLAGIISFVVVRIQIKFAYYLFYFTSVELEQTGIAAVSKRVLNIKKWMLYTNFLLPLVIVLLFVNPLCKDSVVPAVLPDAVFDGIRLFIVSIACVSRALTFRDELQFQFNESYFLVHRMMLDKNV